MIAAETSFGVFHTWPTGLRSLLAVDKAIDGADLPADLLELVRLRVSQINGCAYCVAMHAESARERGVLEQVLTMLVVWRESALFSARERAALAIAEALTRPTDAVLLSSTVLDAKRMFTKTELTQLAYAIATINAWNRLALADGLAPASESGRP